MALLDIKELTRRVLSQRFDANDTAFLERQLTYLRAKVQEVLYPENMAMQFIPLANDIPASADTYAWEILDKTGQAKVIAKGSDDLPRVDVSAQERKGTVVNVGASYGWDVDELAESARLNVNVPARKALAARSAIDLQVDNLLALGQTGQDVALPFTGFINNADVIAQGLQTAVGAVTTPWIYGTTTAQNMLDTLNNAVNQVVVGSKQLFYPDTWLLPTNEFMIIAQQRVGTNENAETVLQAFLKNNPFIKNVAPWPKLVGAGHTPTTFSRGICYKRDPQVLEGVVPQLFTQLAPQPRNLDVVIPCKARAGGTMVYHPLAVQYVDFHQ